MSRYLGFGLALFLLTGCGEEPSSNPAAATPAAPAAPAAAKKAKETTEALEGDDLGDGESVGGYSYNPIGKRDPFRSFIAGETDEKIVDPTPLQRYDVDQYKLVGIIWGGGNPRAMVQDPEGTGHVIQLGTYIGKNWGKITQITSQEVVVTEEYQTMEGELVTNQMIMALPNEELPLAE